MTIEYPTPEDIHAIHDVVVANDADTDPGVKSPGDIEFAIEYISEGYYGQVPESIHEKAAHLMRLIAEGHPFVDGNKRTALDTAESFYQINGYHPDFGDDVEDVLEDFAKEDVTVDLDRVVSYLEAHTAKRT